MVTHNIEINHTFLDLLGHGLKHIVTLPIF
jgi:hypothetical protein